VHRTPTGLIQAKPPDGGAAHNVPHITLPSESIEPDTSDNDVDEEDDDELINEINQEVKDDDADDDVNFNPDPDPGQAPTLREPMVEPARPVSRRRAAHEVGQSEPASSSRRKAPRVSSRASGSVRVGADRSANSGKSSFWMPSTVWMRDIPFIERTDQKNVLHSVFIFGQ